MRYGLFDWRGYVVDEHHGYQTSSEADEAIGYWERGDRRTHDGVHVGTECSCPEGEIVHEYDSAKCVPSE